MTRASWDEQPKTEPVRGFLDRAWAVAQEPLPFLHLLRDRGTCVIGEVNHKYRHKAEMGVDLDSGAS